MAAKNDRKEIWVFIEQSYGDVNNVSLELLGEAKKLAKDVKASVAGILLGDKTAPLTADIFSYGADLIYQVDDPVLNDYRTQTYTKAFVDLAKKYKPEIVLMGATVTGRDLASAVATHLETGLTADCTMLEIDEETGLLKQTRPAWGGNVMATILCKDHRPQMATVRPRVFEVPMPVRKRGGRIIKDSIDLAEEDVKTKIIDFIPGESGKAVEIESSEIIVAGGRGLANQKNLDLLRKLAELLGAELGASRPVIEMGWLSYDHQVGQTGKTVRPNLYVAVGISGAVQHLAGMQNSNTIVAINSDPEAPIFKVADYGIVGDLLEVLPELIGALSKYT